MSIGVIEPGPADQSSPDDLRGLQAHLLQLVGERFQFARVSYGDELTLHFGDLRPARSPKLKGKLYGAYILGMRASPWLLKSGSVPGTIFTGADLPQDLGRPITREELENARLVEPDSVVVAASAFRAIPKNGFGLQLRMSDGASLFVLPAEATPADQDDDDLPELADWELQSPTGLLSVGSGFQWSFKAVVARPHAAG